MTSNHAGSRANIVLIAGLWLPRSVWDDVSAALTRLGHRVVTPPLPGVDIAQDSTDLEDQLAAVLTAVDAAKNPVVVGHSAASTLAWMVADRRPTQVARIVMIGGFPTENGGLYADFFPMADAVMPFPGWDPFEGPDADDLDADARERFTDLAISVPLAVARSTVSLTDERRFAVPVSLVCPEYSPADAKAWIDAGDLPELARTANLSYVDIDSGHWTMVTKPEELARILDVAIREC